MRKLLMLVGMALSLTVGTAVPLTAQVRTVDPNQAIDSDIGQSGTPSSTAPSAPPPQDYPPAQQPGTDTGLADPYPQDQPSQASNSATATTDTARSTTRAAETYNRKDLIGAGEGVFGKGAEGLAGIIEKILKDQGEPNAYIAGREASGAFVIGARYGSGLMSHKVEGNRPVYWTGPSVGFDLGGNASKVFVLVYNLYDTEEIFRRYPEGEGHLYFVGGFSATYLRRGNIVLIPIRLGVGLRAGVNIGYMKFSKKAKWLPL